MKEKLGDKLKVGTVGSLENAKLANQMLEDGLDLAIVGRGFQKNPSLVWTWAEGKQMKTLDMLMLTESQN